MPCVWLNSAWVYEWMHSCMLAAEECAVLPCMPVSVSLNGCLNRLVRPVLTMLTSIPSFMQCPLSINALGYCCVLIDEQFGTSSMREVDHCGHQENMASFMHPIQWRFDQQTALISANAKS